MKKQGRRDSVIALIVVTGVAVFVGGCSGSPSTTTSTSKTPEKTSAEATPASPKAPLVPKIEVADWCGEHGIPESLCSMCSDKVAEECKKKGDWCKEHNRAESQCFVCHPEQKEKFEAMKPKAVKGAD